MLTGDIDSALLVDATRFLAVSSTGVNFDVSETWKTRESLNYFVEPDLVERLLVLAPTHEQ